MGNAALGSKARRLSAVGRYEIADRADLDLLTVAEVRALFYAGRLRRDSPCRLNGKPQWRTVDELFPLLKYDASVIGSLADYFDQEEPPRFLLSRRGAVGLGLAAVAVSFLAIAVYYGRGQQPGDRPIKMPSRSTVQQTASTPSSRTTIQTASPPSIIPNSNPQPVPSASGTRSVPPVRKESQQAVSARLDRERLAREQLQREQAALADAIRAKNQQDIASAQKAAGVDTIVPLDMYYPVDVGGSVLSVRIHDNDVTSFDAWVGGRWHREVKKNKGLNGSRTDETLIYDAGGASLYYVWELSGKLNHCRLRVRQD